MDNTITDRIEIDEDQVSFNRVKKIYRNLNTMLFVKIHVRRLSVNQMKMY